jgi:hypothetical protein
VLLREDGTDAIEPTPLVGRFVGFAGAREGLLHLVLRDASGCHHARFDPTQRAMVSVTPISDCISQPRLTADERLMGIARVSGQDDTPGDPEVVMVDPVDGHVRALTRGTFREANPQVAPNGDRIAFERHLDSPDGLRGDRSVVCWVDP